MQEQKWDGGEELTDQASIEDFKEAMDNPKNKSITLHKSGSTFTNTNGVEYRVSQEARIKPIRRAKRKLQRQARKKNRR